MLVLVLVLVSNVQWPGRCLWTRVRLAKMELEISTGPDWPDASRVEPSATDKIRTELCARRLCSCMEIRRTLLNFGDVNERDTPNAPSTLDPNTNPPAGPYPTTPEHNEHLFEAQGPHHPDPG